jgi:moderate conductance mechanosensitive channel
MNWDQFFSRDTLISLGIPVGIGILVAVAVFVIRFIIFKYIKKMAAKTKTQFDDIMVAHIRIPTLLWCFWIGIDVGFKVYAAPDSWAKITDQLIPVLYVALGIFTIVMILIALFKWYRLEVCSLTASTLDDSIMKTLIWGTPTLGIGLGTLLILNMLGIKSEVVNTYLEKHGLKMGISIIVIVTLLLLTILIIPRVIDRAVRNSSSEQSEEEMKKRSDTLESVIITAFQVMLIFMLVMMILSEIGINVTALLTGAGVISLAVAFGAQSLVKDMLAGLFIIMENQYRKGDVIKIAGESGVVEEINLRRTVLRDVDGTYHVVPNGEIKVSSNLTKLLSRVNLTISVSYETDLDKAIAVINRVGKEMSEDPLWVSFILTPPKALRVDKLGDSGIDIRIMGETKPSRQWEVTGELRLRLKKAFDKEGIDIPYPHTKVIFGNLPPEIGRPDDFRTEPSKK